MSKSSLIFPLPMNGDGFPCFETGDIANGFSDIALLLGKKPSDCVFMHSLVVDTTHNLDRRVAATDDLDVRSNQYVLGLSGEGSVAAHFALTKEHDIYVREFLEEGSLLSVKSKGSGRLFPDGSLIANIKAAFAQESAKTRFSSAQLFCFFSGKTLVNSYCLTDAQTLAAQIGGNTLNSTESYLRFLCKSFVRDYSKGYGIPIAPGTVIRSPEDIDSAYSEMSEKIRRDRLDPSKTKVWIKAGSLSGGQGIVSVKGLSKKSWNHAFRKIAQAYYNSGFYACGASRPDRADFNKCEYFMPVVADIDVGHLPDVENIQLNACVQSVISSSGVTIVGTTLQHTVNGEYRGSVMPTVEQRPEIFTAQKEAQTLMNALQKEGYRGFAGVDVLVARMKDHSLKGFVLEVNPRLNSSTPLLRLVQHASFYSGKPRTGNSADYVLPNGVNPMLFLRKAIGYETFYQREKTGYKGFIPVMIDQPPGRPVHVKGVVLEETSSSAAALQKKILARLNQFRI